MRQTENIRRHIGETVTIRWGVSRGRNTYGYTTCSLRNHRGQRVAACNGGGYDMRGTVVGHWLAATFPKELNALKPSDMPEHGGERRLYGLSYHDPTYDPGKAIVGEDCDDRTFGERGAGKTVEQAEKDGDTVGLERYQAFHKASSPVPSKRHTVPLIDGACGISSVMHIAHAIGIGLDEVHHSSKLNVYAITDARKK